MFNTCTPDSENTYDAILVGAGIMSSTLAVLLHELEPDLRLLVVEKLSSAGLESSCAKNNAGTGHAANCELNYTPIQEDGHLSTTKAFEINKSFEQSLEFWASLAEKGKLIPKTFLNKLKRLRKLRIDLNENNNIDQVINSFKPPIFWKDKNIIKQQIKIWELNDIENFIVDLNNTESLIKKNPQISNQIINNMILDKIENANIQI